MYDIESAWEACVRDLCTRLSLGGNLVYEVANCQSAYVVDRGKVVEFSFLLFQSYCAAITMRTYTCLMRHTGEQTHTGSKIVLFPVSTANFFCLLEKS